MFFQKKNLVVWILWHLVLNVILLLSLQDKLPFFKPPPTTMNHQQCRQGTPTEVVVLVLCLSTKVIHIYVYAQCVCKVMCISDVCTFFDCQVPISNSAMRGGCKWNLRRRNRSTWGWERNEDVVIFALTQSGFLCFISMGSRDVKYIQH